MTLREEILQAEKGKTHLFSVGQAGFIIKSASGQLLAIDLYLSDCVKQAEGHKGFKRLLPFLLSPEEVEFDCIIATHPHYDHFDPESIPGLMANGKTICYASVECEKEVERLDLSNDRFEYIKPGDTRKQGDFLIHFINCDHGIGAPDAVGVIVEVDGKIILEAGDTCLRLDRVEEYRQFGEIDVMIAPINGAYGNLNEAECVQLAAAIQPKVLLPCHYGMFASHGGDLNIFYEAAKKTGLEENVLFMRMGEHYNLGE